MKIFILENDLNVPSKRKTSRKTWRLEGQGLK
jgi:hypothetical protein